MTQAALDLRPRQLLVVKRQPLTAGRIVVRIVGGLGEQFGQREQSDQRYDQWNAAGQLADAERKTHRAADRIHTDDRNEHAQNPTDEALCHITVGHAGDDRKADERRPFF